MNLNGLITYLPRQFCKMVVKCTCIDGRPTIKLVCVCVCVCVCVLRGRGRFGDLCQKLVEIDVFPSSMLCCMSCTKKYPPPQEAWGDPQSGHLHGGASHPKNPIEGGVSHEGRRGWHGNGGGAVDVLRHINR